MKKKLLSIFTIILVICIISMCFIACSCDNETPNTTDDSKNQILPYEIDKTGCLQRFYAADNNSVNIIIPATYSIDENGKLISGVAYEIKTIGAHCFANNTLIESVIIPNTVTSIEECAFYNCAKLNTVNITGNIKNIGKDAFELCPKLNTITKSGKSGLIIEKNENLSSFTIPNSITKLEDDSFANWTKLSSISIGENIKHIGNNAFSHCNNLSKVSISSSLNYLGDTAFDTCEKLTSLTTSEKNNGIYFAPNQSLSSYIVPLSIKTIENGFFYGWKQLEELNIHESITSLGMIFKDNESLTKLTCASDSILSLFFHHANYNAVIESEKMYVVSYKPYSVSSTNNYYIPKTLTEIHLLGEIDELTHKNRDRISEIILMVQLEVAKRIVANENSENKEYGQLSILSQMYCDTEIIKKVPKNCFSPAPKVDSALVKFKINQQPKCDITKLLKRTVKAIFMARRKNVKNSLLNAGFIGVEQALEKAQIDKNQRGEKLSLKDIQKLSIALEEFN